MSNGYTRQKESAAARTAKAPIINCGNSGKPHGNTKHVPNTGSPKGKTKIVY